MTWCHPSVEVSEPQVNEKRPIYTSSWIPEERPVCRYRTDEWRKLPGTMRKLFPRRASTVREVGALSDLDNISVRVADVAARLAVLGDRLCDELRSSTFH